MTNQAQQKNQKNSKYQIVYVDPPWDYKGQLQHSGKGKPTSGGARVHYSTIKLAQLKTMPVNKMMADDALLFLWTTSPHLDQAIDLIKSWGLNYATVGFVWDKMKVNPGFYTMSQCEMCLIAKKGKIPQPRGARNIRQFVQSERSKHSTKPSEVRSRIEKMFPDSTKIELFARTPSPGWDVWGHDVDEHAPPHIKDFMISHGW